MASSMSVSVGCGLSVSSADADMIWPDWQYPHCATSCSSQAFWIFAPTAVAPIASIVVILDSPTLSIVVMQERTAEPSRCTVQAPHSAIPQPNFVPVIPSTSRRTHSSGVSPSTSMLRGVPLMLMVKPMISLHMFRTRPPLRHRRRLSSKPAAILSAAELSDVETQSILDVAGTVEAACHQRLDPVLARGTAERGQKCIPLRPNFQICRQARDVNETLGLSDRLLVERRNAHCERFDKPVKFEVRQRPIDVAVPFGEVAGDIIGTEQHFERAPSPHQTRQSRHRPAARHQAGADLPLRQDRLLATCETHVARQRKLTANSGRAAPNRGDGYDRRTAESDKHVGKRLQPGRSRRDAH